MLQRLLLTWLVEEPGLYTKVQRFLSTEDFTDDLYREVAELLFADMEQNKVNPAAIISHFTDEESQREAASVFNTNLEKLSTKQDREKAFHDIIVGVKRNSYEYSNSMLGTDVKALTKVIEGKKALEELEKTHISLD